MIVVDTNVLSELMSAAPHRSVVVWLDTQSRDEIWTTSITLYELLHGIERMPTGRKRHDVETAFEKVITASMGNRILPFEEVAASTAAKLTERRRRAGRPISLADAQIAGIVLANRAKLATRDVDDFSGIGIDVINPWTAA